MNRKPLHINLDAGEGLVDERPLYPYVHALNIACGGHAGSVESVKQTLEMGTALGLQLGAHPSYPDKAHFGRRSMRLNKEALKGALTEQLDLFQSQIEKLGLQWTHLKAHGALYNDLAQDQALSENFLSAIAPFMSDKTLYVQQHSALAQCAEDQGFHCTYEYFIDRRYLNASQLLSRSDPRGVIHSAEECLTQLRLMQEGYLIDVNQQKHAVDAHTFCVHSDHPNTQHILQTIHGA